MRIDDLNRTPVTQGTEKTEQAGQQRTQEKDRVEGAGDQAQISELARALAAKDPQRLEQLRLEVESGKYNVPAEAVAKALLDAHLKK